MGDSSSRWEPGRLVGDHYRVEKFLDEGSAGEVYAGQNVWIGRGVALKRLQPQHHRESVLVERFMLEGRIGGRIDHPNIVQTLDMAKDPSDDSFFIVQELLQGVGLRTLVHRSPQWFYRDALDLVIPLLGALVAVHQHGIVHRDIKPENIFVADSIMGHTVPKLLDFGIAKVRLAQTLTQAGSLLGTVDYMAPEQIEGRKDVDRRVDVWAVGVLTYELLTGQCPFAAPNPAVSLTKIMAHHPPPAHELVPNVPVAVSAAIERAMRKNRQERHESMQQLLEELLRWSATSAEELDRALTIRHRTSLPAAVEQKMRAGVITMAPSSMRTSIMASAHRSGQFRLPESLRDLAAFMDGGERVAEPSGEPESPTPDSPEPLEPLCESSEVDQTIPPEPRASDDWELDELIAAAYSCLRKHEFSEAYRVAEDAIQRLQRAPEMDNEGPSAGPEHARLLLLQAEAAYWGGNYDAHEACVIGALALTLHHDRDWFRCIAELAESTSLLGLHDRLSDLVEELANAKVVDETAPDYVIACCRLGIALQRAGWPEQVEAVLGRLSAEMYDLADRHPSVQAWLCLLRSELAGYAGDHGYRLDLTRQAVAAFERAGNLRRACLFRGNVGSAQMLLGDYERARRSLSASLEEASAMHLAGAVSMRLNLGITLARLGRVEEGEECLMRALRVFIRSGDWAGECSARVYLAEILWMQGERERAEREAQAAVERAHISPVIQAEALGMLSMIQQDRPMESLMAASQAMELLQSVGVAEGEARIRLAYALALDALGHHEPAAIAYAQGRDRLIQRAQRITDENWRASFLQRVPDHARALALAEARGALS